MMGCGRKIFISIFLFILPILVISAQKTKSLYSDELRVSKPIIMVNGKKVTDEAVVKGSDMISVKAGRGEDIILNFSYLMGGVRKNSRDLRHGRINQDEADNINLGAFKLAARGTVWIVSFYAQRGNERGETEVVIFTKGD